MRKIYFLLMMFFLSKGVLGQVAAWDFNGESSPATSVADVFNTNLDASNQITRGTGATASTGANSFRTTGFQNNGISTANTDYFQVTLSATAGFTLSLSTIDANFAGTTSFAASPGVSNQFAYSLDGSTFTLIGSPSVTTGSPATLPQIDLSGIPALQNVGEATTITIRYYASGQTTTGGWGFISSSPGQYGLSIGGTLTPAAGCSGAPATQAGFGTITPTHNTASININAGTGGVGRVIKINTSNTFTDMVDGANPSASTSYSSGEQVIFNGTGTGPINMSGLTGATTYWLAAYEYNCASGRFYLNPGATTSFTTPAAPVIAEPGDILINQFSPDYDGASDEFIELVNTTGKTLDLSTLAIRYQSAGGTSNAATGGALTGTLLPHHYWVLSPNATITVGQTVAMPRDGNMTSGFAHPSGQFALVRVSDDVVIDAVGYGTVTVNNYTETSAAPAPPANGAIKRNPNAVDTDDNSVDFVTVANAVIKLHNSTSIPLPVKFGNVKATPQGSGVKIDWSNFTETDVVNYKVERSVNGQPFTALGTVAARANNGSRADYTHFDAMPVNGVNLYRIQSLEMDGKQLNSVIVRVDTRTGKTTVTIYPNPATATELSFQATDLQKGNYTIRVYNAAGQQVHSKKLVHAGGFITESLELPASLQSGVYHLQIMSADVRLSKTFMIK